MPSTRETSLIDKETRALLQLLAIKPERGTETQTMDNITQARHNFVLAFQYCWNGTEFPIFREISVSEGEQIHTGYCAIDLLDDALNLHPDFQEARTLRSEIWHAILANNNSRYIYRKYLSSKAWAETREKFFEQAGRLCICDDTATEVHHKTYDNIGKENLLTDLAGLCDRCHERVHQPGEVYWGKFETYVEENGNQLQFFPEPDLPSVFGIQIDQRTLNSGDIFEDGAFWLIAYRSRNELQANLCMESSMHYDHLKTQQDTIQGQFEDILDELKWKDDKKWIGFSDNTVGHVRRADRDQEFPWLHDRLVRLHEVFQPRVLKLQKGT